MTVPHFFPFTYSGSTPVTFTLQCSTDGTSWTDVGSATSQITGEHGVRYEITGSDHLKLFRYQVENACSTVTTDAVRVTCSDTGGENSAPTAADDVASVTVGNTGSVNVVSNDSDSDGTIDTSSVALVPGGSSDTTSDGVWTATTGGNVTFTPNAGLAAGVYCHDYNVADNDGATDSAEACFTVTSAPVSCTPDLSTETCFTSTVAIVTNSTKVCGTSNWDYSSSASGPWGDAYNINATCGLSPNPALAVVTDAGWIAPTANGQGISPGPHYFRYTFPLTAAEAAAATGLIGQIAGDTRITNITLNGTQIYSGTPVNQYDTTATVSLPASALVNGSNELVFEGDYDGFDSDGISVNLQVASTTKLHRFACVEDPAQFIWQDDNGVTIPAPVGNVVIVPCDDAPVITQNPADQTTTIGSTVTFTAASTGGDAPVSCIWQEETSLGVWQNIPGETSGTIDVVGQ